MQLFKVEHQGSPSIEFKKTTIIVTLSKAQTSIGARQSTYTIYVNSYGITLKKYEKRERCEVLF